MLLHRTSYHHVALRALLPSSNASRTVNVSEIEMRTTFDFIYQNVSHVDGLYSFELSTTRAFVVACFSFPFTLTCILGFGCHQVCLGPKDHQGCQNGVLAQANVDRSQLLNMAQADYRGHSRLGDEKTGEMKEATRSVGVEVKEWMSRGLSAN